MKSLRAITINWLKGKKKVQINWLRCESSNSNEGMRGFETVRIVEVMERFTVIEHKGGYKESILHQDMFIMAGIGGEVLCL